MLGLSVASLSAVGSGALCYHLPGFCEGPLCNASMKWCSATPAPAGDGQRGHLTVHPPQMEPYFCKTLGSLSRVNAACDDPVLSANPAWMRIGDGDPGCSGGTNPVMCCWVLVADWKNVHEDEEDPGENGGVLATDRDSYCVGTVELPGDPG